jgi:hypothetical protein
MVEILAEKGVKSDDIKKKKKKLQARLKDYLEAEKHHDEVEAAKADKRKWPPYNGSFEGEFLEVHKPKVLGQVLLDRGLKGRKEIKKAEHSELVQWCFDVLSEEYDVFMESQQRELTFQEWKQEAPHPHFNSQFDMHRKFIAACRGGNMKKVEKYIGLGVDLDYQNELGESPLMCAAYQNHLEIARKLLEEGADPHLVNKLGESAVALASLNQNQEIIDLIRRQWKCKENRVQVDSLDNAIEAYKQEWTGFDEAWA